MANTIPKLIEPLELAALLPHHDLLIVDVSGADAYLRGHLPGAVHLDYNTLILGQPPAPGLLPPAEQLARALRAIGLARDRHVVAYDDHANSRASRLLWTLEAVGHPHSSLLNGALAAWLKEGYAVERGPGRARQTEAGAESADFSGEFNPGVLADKGYVLAALHNPQVVILDARTPAEYNGLKSPSLRNGRIPGAVNLNWLDTLDRDNHFRLLPDAALRAQLAQLGVTPDKEIITYCQTHHRSSHSFVMLRHLGFDKVRGYAGSWSEWGNDPGLPME